MVKRLFVSIDLPPSIEKALVDLDPRIRGVRWTPGNQMHLTLGFFPDVTGDVELALREKLNAIEFRAFFLPIDRFNERYEELAAHPDWSFHGARYSKRDLLDQRDRVFARHPKTTFVAAHVAESSENLAYVRDMLDLYPNVFVDIGARTAELGRQPYRARQFFIDYADRILFGTDLLTEVNMYRLHFRFLETDDEYFEYPSHASRQGRWNIYGLHLPDDVLRKVYRENALRLLG